MCPSFQTPGCYRKECCPHRQTGHEIALNIRASGRTKKKDEYRFDRYSHLILILIEIRHFLNIQDVAVIGHTLKHIVVNYSHNFARNDKQILNNSWIDCHFDCDYNFCFSFFHSLVKLIHKYFAFESSNTDKLPISVGWMLRATAHTKLYAWTAEGKRAAKKCVLLLLSPSSSLSSLSSSWP